MKRVLLYLSVILAFSVPTISFALEPLQREVIVTHNRVWDGFKYVENFTPSDANELVLTAGGDHAVSFVRTQEYYWPLARQKFVSFETQRDELRGILRIYKGNILLEEVANAEFSIEYPDGVINGNARVIWGAAASETHAQYLQSEQEFAREFATARRLNTQYEIALRDAAEASNNGEEVPEIQAPPPLPEPSLRLVTAPVRGYRINLPEGEYELVVYIDEHEQPETRRHLRVTAAEQNELQLVAEIVPEERWTRPLDTNTLSDTIYVRPGATFFATLHEANRYNEPDYLAMTRPQAVGTDGRTIWIKRRPSEQSGIQVAWDGAGATTIKRTELKVEQTRGSQFGYVVREARDREIPDLSAFVVNVPENGIGDGSIFLEGADFDRRIKVILPSNSLIVWGFALFPLLFGIGRNGLKKRKMFLVHDA